MKLSRSFLMVTTVTVVGLATGSAFAQPNLAPATPAQPAPPAPPVPATEPTPPAAPGEVDPRISFRPGEALVQRLLLGGALGERLEAIDTDGDGKISAAEFQAATEALFTELDTNGDGVLDNADRRELAVGDGAGPGTGPGADRGDERQMQVFRGGMMGPNGGMMFFRGGPMFWGMPGMWFFAVPMGPQGGPDFRGGPNFQFQMPGPGGGDGGNNNGPNGGNNNGPNGGNNNGPNNNGPTLEFRMGPGGQGGGQWFYWQGPQRRD